MESMLKFSEKFPFVTVAKKQRNPYLNRYISENRKHLNITLLEKSKKTSRELFEYAEEGKNIALFSDHRDKGTTVDFFGMETVSPTGAATLALRYNRPLILGYSTFIRDNTTSVHFKKIDVVCDEKNSFKENVHLTTQRLIYMMEDIITCYPEQWMWTTSVHFKKIDVVCDEKNSFKENVHLTTQRLIYMMEDIITCYPEQWMWLHDRWKLYKVFTGKNNKKKKRK